VASLTWASSSALYRPKSSPASSCKLPHSQAARRGLGSAQTTSRSKASWPRATTTSRPPDCRSTCGAPERKKEEIQTCVAYKKKRICLLRIYICIPAEIRLDYPRCTCDWQVALLTRRRERYIALKKHAKSIQTTECWESLEAMWAYITTFCFKTSLNVFRMRKTCWTHSLAWEWSCIHW